MAVVLFHEAEHSEFATPTRKGEGRGATLSSPAHAVREGDPPICSALWIPFPSAFAPAGNDTEVSAPLSSPAVRRTGKGIHNQALLDGFPDPAMAFAISGRE
jgi:hypothetical protein